MVAMIWSSWQPVRLNHGGVDEGRVGAGRPTMANVPTVPDFIASVVAARDLVFTSTHDHDWQIEPRESALSWHCDLFDGTPTGENDPSSHARWVSPSLRLVRSDAGRAVPPIDVRRSGPQSDLGRLAARFGRLLGVGDDPTSVDSHVYTDPLGVIDAPLRDRIENGPTAMHGDGVVRTVGLTSIRVTGEGLVVLSAGWWDSAAALDHQIALAIDVATRLAARQAT